MPGVPPHAFDNLKAKLKEAFSRKPKKHSEPSSSTEAAKAPEAGLAAPTKTEEVPAAAPAAAPATGEETAKPASAVAGTEDPAAKVYPTPDEAAAAGTAPAPAPAPAPPPTDPTAPVDTPVAPVTTVAAEEPKKEEAKPAAI